MASKKQWAIILLMVLLGVQNSVTTGRGVAYALGGAVSMFLLTYAGVALYNRGEAEAHPA